jgi:hypothetical protein
MSPQLANNTGMKEGWWRTRSRRHSPWIYYWVPANGSPRHLAFKEAGSALADLRRPASREPDPRRHRGVL